MNDSQNRIPREKWKLRENRILREKFAIISFIAFIFWLGDLPMWIHHPLGFIWIFSLVAYFYTDTWDILIIKKPKEREWWEKESD